MRIVHVVVTDAFAGAERHVARLARAQTEAGHEVVVVGGRETDMRAGSGPAVRYLPGTALRTAAHSLRIAARRADIVHTHLTAAETAALLSPAVALGQVPLVTTRHIALRRGQSRLGGLAAPLIRRRVAAQIAISEYTAQHIDGSSVVVYAGLPPAAAAVAPREPVVLVAQRLEAEKRTDLAVRAFAGSGLAARGWRLEIAGEGALEGELRDLVNELGVRSAVSFLGYQKDVGALLERASVLLAPCPVEGFGLTVLEAMSQGTPVVADGSAGHLELLGPLATTGTYATANAEAAASALGVLAASEPDRQRYGEALRMRQQSLFSLQAQVRATDAVYRGVL